MPITVDTHPRGISIQMSRDVSRQELGRVLTAIIPRDLILSGPGEFILPGEVAHQVEGALKQVNYETMWSPAAQTLISAQRELHSRATAAWIEVAEALADSQTALANYPRLAMLDPHQVAAVAAMTVPSLIGIALFDEQGLGKTVMALAAFDRLRQHNPTTRLLVVAPKSALASWQDDSMKIFGKAYSVVQMGGDELTRRRLFRKHADITLCNYETLATDADVIQRSITGSQKPWVLVVDEAFFVKNPDARRSKGVLQVRRVCDRVIVLCGTPAPNSPADLLNQLALVNAGLDVSNSTSWKDKDRIFELATNALNATIYLRRLKSEVLPDLPQKQIERVLVKLSPKQQEMYDEAFDQLVVSVRSTDEQTFQRNLASFLARRVVLTQICSNPAMIDSSYKEEPAKLLALDTLLKELVEEKGLKVVIWSFYRYSLEHIARRYFQYGLVRIDGTVSRFQDRREAIYKFQNDQNIRIFLGNAAAAGAGITLTAAHHAIYESFSNQAVHYLQSVDRIHRRGQTHDVISHILLGANTIELGEYERILEKERTGRELLGDKYDEPMTRERFLAELNT